MSCVSWLRLELHVLGPADAEVAAHVAGCAACRACVAQIRGDVVVLPPLPAVARRRWATWFGGGGVALAVAAAALFLFLRPRAPGPRVHVKGAGEVVLSVVRERDGVVVFDPTGFRAGDRFKLRVTCDPGAAVWADVVVYQPEASFPFPAAVSIPCGNNVTLPGAFRLTERTPARVCVALASDGAPSRAAPAKGSACASLGAEE